MKLLRQSLNILLVGLLMFSLATGQRPVKSSDKENSIRRTADVIAQENGDGIARQQTRELNAITVFSIPVGAGGVSYEGGEAEDTETWGPAGLHVAPDGTFFISDTVGKRILRYRLDGKKLDAISVDGAAAVTGITVRGSEIFALDAAAVEPTVHRFSSDGILQEITPVPSELRSKGLSGITLSEYGEVMIEIHGGASATNLYPGGTEGKSIRGERLTVQGPNLTDQSADLSTGFVSIGSEKFGVNVENDLGGLSVIGTSPEGDLFVLVNEISDSHVLHVDQTVRKYGRDGKLKGVARVPIRDRYTYVRNGVAVAPDGNVYALITRPDRADVLRLVFTQQLDSILSGADGRDEFTDQQAAGSKTDSKATVSAGQAQCRSRDDMINMAWSYFNNRTSLSVDNINGYSCSGRKKPPHLKVGEYKSVTYAWGRAETPGEFNEAMKDGKPAGDIDTVGDGKSCVRGVDCSGLVTRAWGFGPGIKYGTETLPTISEPIQRSQAQRGDVILKRKKHAVLIESVTSDEVSTLESLTDGYDRVEHLTQKWDDRFDGWEVFRFKNVCSTVQAKVATPSISPGSQSSQSPVKASISTTTSGATIRYTTTGSDPTSTSTIYSSPLTFNSSVTLKARAFKNGITNSDVASASYTIVHKVATPSISPGSQSSQSPVKASISTTTSGATIRYTTTGSDPTSTSTIYSSPLTFNSSVTLKARAFKNGITNSDVASATYSIVQKVATPSISPGSQSSQSPVKANISTTTSGATIRYTTTGSDPTSTSTIYSSPLTFNSSVTLKARAFKNGITNSDVASATYTIVQKVATPSISPGSQSSQSPVKARISTNTSGATIRYTTNGSDPTSTSTIYSSPLTFNSSVTLKARAFKNGMTNSDLASATYTIVQKVATPSISPGSQSSKSSVKASISTTTSGATIRYTTNGSDPTSTSTIYSGSLTFNSSVTLKARAFKSGMTNSNVASATYSISKR